MKVSVIIPTYNRENLICRAVQSVLDQTEQAFEIIVVDDGSEDRTKEELKKFGEKIKVIFQKNSGPSSARNTGIKNSKGDFIAFLDSDDYWLRNKLQKQKEYHKKNPHFLISQTDEVWIKNGKVINKKKYHQKIEGNFYIQSLERCMISPSCVLINKEIFNNIGLFDETLPACEDYDLFLRITLKHSVGLVKEPLVVKTGGRDDQLTTKIWGLDRFRVKSLEKILKENMGDFERRKTIETLIKKLKILHNGCSKRKKEEEAEIYREKALYYCRIFENGI